MTETKNIEIIQPSIQNYFKQLQTRLVLGLIICILIPNAVLTAYFHFQFTQTLKRSGINNLATISESQQNTFAFFFEEMFRARRILTVSLVLINLAILVLIVVTTKKLIRKAHATAQKGKILEHQLIHASKLASIGELATGVAHEINNPLAIITSTTGVIRDMFNPQFSLNPEPKNVIEELDIIEEAAFRAKNITYQLLDMGRKAGPYTEDVNVNELIDGLLKGLKERECAVNNIHIVKDYTNPHPILRTDRDRLRQVILNLVNNAGDAISGSGTITVSTSVLEGCVQISVADTGEGIKQENLERIFRPFFTTKGVGKGTGLGLSISARIVESMGGEISVQSTIGKGSVFTVSLPIHHE